MIKWFIKFVIYVVLLGVITIAMWNMLIGQMPTQEDVAIIWKGLW